MASNSQFYSHTHTNTLFAAPHTHGPPARDSILYSIHSTALLGGRHSQLQSSNCLPSLVMYVCTYYSPLSSQSHLCLLCVPFPVAERYQAWAYEQVCSFATYLPTSFYLLLLPTSSPVVPVSYAVVFCTRNPRRRNSIRHGSNSPNLVTGNGDLRVRVTATYLRGDIPATHFPTNTWRLLRFSE